jgi:hypothetical protein
MRTTVRVPSLSLSQDYFSMKAEAHSDKRLHRTLESYNERGGPNIPGLGG